ncbi:hypothetical protein SAMN04488118_11127 [Epibacterium ulvae]|uniref:Methyltransferase domain-containing protein n=1 Tax=Epibacterium ulvae TaxID=1156985 RepID=A0A1G5RAI3_9RHOB|nr:class I SAM-dependent methyltransferase [Epibacterium ulvae]SCZ70858.1 hypothetical protein SAMN04488118_11127 [Epibacterium ulvae]
MGFSSEWLALREPADHAARDASLLQRVADFVGPQATVLDLGSGTGSTVRAFQGVDIGQWRWRFVDSDPVLLAEATSRHTRAEAHMMNLQDLEDLPLNGVSLVTASALLDLMPDRWIAALAQRLAAAQIPFYAALNYNGDMRWSPGLTQDKAIRDAFNRHQNTDKGIGAATGAASAQVTQSRFEEHGFQVHLAESPWVLDPKEQALQRDLLGGIAQAADEMGAAAASHWFEERQASLATGQTVIGHTDVLALPCVQSLN